MSGSSWIVALVAVPAASPPRSVRPYPACRMASVLGSGVFNWTLAFYARCLVIHGGLLYALRLQQTLSAAVKAGMRQSVCWAGWSRRRRSGLPLEVRRADAMMWAMLPPARQCFSGGSAGFAGEVFCRQSRVCCWCSRRNKKKAALGQPFSLHAIVAQRGRSRLVWPVYS